MEAAQTVQALPKEETPSTLASGRRSRPWTQRPSFVGELKRLHLRQIAAGTDSASSLDAERALSYEDPSLGQAAALLSPAARALLPAMIALARSLTTQRFGKTVQLYAPLYLSNHCVCTCTYCGFSMGNEIARRTLTVDEVGKEAEVLAARGFRHMLLVSGEHPKHVVPEYLARCLQAAGAVAHSVYLEVQAQDERTYAELREAGCDGVVIYQETYDREAYGRLHLHGMKKDMEWRLDAPDRIGGAGIRNAGLGVLLGINKSWRTDVLALIAHARYLQRSHWRTNITVALPRLKDAAGGFKGPVTVSDGEFVQAICALRIALPEAGIVLSTREPAQLRDALVGVGVTQMSAGSSTEPGGYSSAGESEQQFAVDDLRPPQVVAEAVSDLGYEPVWKDWERCL